MCSFLVLSGALRSFNGALRSFNGALRSLSGSFHFVSGFLEIKFAKLLKMRSFFPLHIILRVGKQRDLGNKICQTDGDAHYLIFFFKVILKLGL
jgi:hypothetical protein